MRHGRRAGRVAVCPNEDYWQHVEASGRRTRSRTGWLGNRYRLRLLASRAAPFEAPLRRQEALRCPVQFWSRSTSGRAVHARVCSALMVGCWDVPSARSRSTDRCPTTPSRVRRTSGPRSPSRCARRAGTPASPRKRWPDCPSMPPAPWSPWTTRTIRQASRPAVRTAGTSWSGWIIGQSPRPTRARPPAIGCSTRSAARCRPRWRSRS